MINKKTWESASQPDKAGSRSVNLVCCFIFSVFSCGYCGGTRTKRGERRGVKSGIKIYRFNQSIRRSRWAVRACVRLSVGLGVLDEPLERDVNIFLFFA